MAAINNAPDELGPRVRVPGIVRFGIWIVIGLLLFFIAIASKFSYRDAFDVPVRIQEEAPMRSATNGRLRMIVRDGETVRKHQVIGFVASSVTFSFVFVHVSPVISTHLKRGDEITLKIPYGKASRNIRGTIDDIENTASDGADLIVRTEPVPAGTNATLQFAAPRLSIISRLKAALFTR